MPTVRELSAPYENFMLGPRPGPNVCATCFNLTNGYSYCYACAHGGDHLDAVLPISYSVAHEQLHYALAAYKRVNGDAGRRLTLQLAAVLWRFLDRHERCLATATATARATNARGANPGAANPGAANAGATNAGAANASATDPATPTFPLVTTVPSGDRHRDEAHPLRRIVGELVAPTKTRHARLLRRSGVQAQPHDFQPSKYTATRPLSGEAVLLIDDTWTTGANAQSAAATLKQAGAGAVAIVVIGRHLNRPWHENDARLNGIARPFDWSECAHCVRSDRPKSSDMTN